MCVQVPRGHWLKILHGNTDSHNKHCLNTQVVFGTFSKATLNTITRHNLMFYAKCTVGTKCKSPQLDRSPYCRCIIYVRPHNDGHIRAHTHTTMLFSSPATMHRPPPLWCVQISSVIVKKYLGNLNNRLFNHN